MADFAREAPIVVHTPAAWGLKSFRELQAWQRAMDLVVACHDVARCLPAAERFALADQLRRSAASVPANIAEGYGRLHRGEYIHHLSMAQGSLKETETHLHIAHRLAYLSDTDLRGATSLCDEVGRLLTRLIASLRR